MGHTSELCFYVGMTERAIVKEDTGFLSKRGTPSQCGEYTGKYTKGNPILVNSDGSIITRNHWLSIGGDSVQVFESFYNHEARDVEDRLQEDFMHLCQGRRLFKEK